MCDHFPWDTHSYMYNIESNKITYWQNEQVTLVLNTHIQIARILYTNLFMATPMINIIQVKNIFFFSNEVSKCCWHHTMQWSRVAEALWFRKHIFVALIRWLVCEMIRRSLNFHTTSSWLCPNKRAFSLGWGSA